MAVVRIQVDVPLEHLLDDSFVGELTRGLAGRGAAHARYAVPVDTGALRESLQVVKTERGHAFGSDLDYAAPVELGYRHAKTGRFIPPQPFLRPAADALTE